MPAPDRMAFVLEARSWIGTPWGHQQRAKGKSVDCLGLGTETMRALAMAEINVRDYGRWPNGTLLAKCREYLLEIPIYAIQPADVVVLQFANAPWHVALVTPYEPMPGHLSIIHATNAIGKVVEHRLTPEWRDKIVAAFAIPGLA